MYKSIVMHQLDYNEIAASEEWYYKCHGPQIARRYGPWLERFESYRPVPLPSDLSAEALGYTNWLTTIGYWREMPEEIPGGNMAMSSPKTNARNFSAFFPPLATEDLKGMEIAPEEKACLRFVQMWQYPEGVDVKAADQEFLDTLAAEIAELDVGYRFFSSSIFQEEIHLPGTWKPEQMALLQKNGNPSDHCWHRIAEVWFETFDEVRTFMEKAKKFKKPSWAQTETFPYLVPYENYVSTFLLERPAFDWMRQYQVYR